MVSTLKLPEWDPQLETDYLLRVPDGLGLAPSARDRLRGRRFHLLFINNLLLWKFLRDVATWPLWGGGGVDFVLLGAISSE